MDYPKNIKIGWADHAVDIKKADEDFVPNVKGRIWHEEQRISIDGALPVEGRATTMLHEVLHGLHYQYDLGLEDEERVVTCFANGLSQVFRDNPKFLKFLSKALNA